MKSVPQFQILLRKILKEGRNKPEPDLDIGQNTREGIKTWR